MSTTLIEKLNLIQDSRDSIKSSLINKGQSVNNDIRTYSTAIDNISTGSSSLNIYMQTTEPEKKEGIWIKQSGRSYDIVVTDKDIDYTAGFSSIFSLPIYVRTSASLGENIYLFGYDTENSVDVPKGFLFKPYNSTFEELPAPPVIPQITNLGIRNGLMYYVNGTNLYTFNIATQEHSLVTNSLPVSVGGKASVLADNMIYFSNNLMSSTKSTFCSYNLDTGVSTTYTTIPDTQINFSMDYKDGLIYIIGGQYAAGNIGGIIRTLNVNTNTWNYVGQYASGSNCRIRLTPHVNINGKLYMFGCYDDAGYNSYYKVNYTLGPSNTSVTAFHSSSPRMVDGIACAVSNNEIYVFSFNDSNSQYTATSKTKKAIRYAINNRNADSSVYNKDTLLLYQGTTYSTELISSDSIQGRNVTYFSDVKFWDAGTQSASRDNVYIGNGTTWVKL